MSRLKLFVVCALGLLALASVSVSSASAQGLPDVLPSSKENGTTAISLTKPIYRTSGGQNIVCETTSTGSSEETESPNPLGLFHIVFRGCVGESFGIKAKCTGTGDKEGEILSLGSYHLVYDTGGTELGLAILFLVAATTFSCSTILPSQTVEGEQVCLIKEPYTLGTLKTMACEPNATEKFKQKEEWLDDNGVWHKPLLIVKEGTSTKEAAEEAEALLLFINVKTKANVDVLIDML